MKLMRIFARAPVVLTVTASGASVAETPVVVRTRRPGKSRRLPDLYAIIRARSSGTV